jgi:hypothetical protein
METLQRQTVKVYFDNGYNFTSIVNGDNETIENYYLNQYFNLGNGENDLMAKCIKIEYIK